MVRAIIFDCYGVLVHDNYSMIKEKYLADDPTARAEFVDLNHRACKGELTGDEFLVKVSELTGVPMSEIDETFDHNYRNDELLNFIARELKPRYKIGFLSNASRDRITELFTPEQVELFDDVVLSYQVHLIKPDPEIYKLSTQRLGVQPEECVFVDDLARYVEMAETLGMRGIWYQNFEQFRDELEKILERASA